ncbi:MAG: hypothetical protein JO367_17480 [Actinobacteria bacterium]|nr:hypothetical protein [Actinomycetota bacterium]
MRAALARVRTSFGWLVIAQLLCLAVIGAATNGTAGRAAVADQSGWLAVAIAAVVVSAGVNGIWLLGARSAVADRRRALLDGLDLRAAGAPLSDPSIDDIDRVVVAGRSLRHRAECPLVVGKRTRPVSGDGPACGWCNP